MRRTFLAAVLTAEDAVVLVTLSLALAVGALIGLLVAVHARYVVTTFRVVSVTYSLLVPIPPVYYLVEYLSAPWTSVALALPTVAAAYILRSALGLTHVGAGYLASWLALGVSVVVLLAAARYKVRWIE